VKLLFVNRFFHPDAAGTALFLTELAEDCAAAGHTVTVVTGDRAGHDPAVRYPRRGVHRGITIHRIRTFRFNRQRVWGWALNAISFYPGALWKLLVLPRQDVTVFLTDPPLIFALGPLVRVLKRTRVVCWSMDVYPDVAIGAGVMAPGSLPARASSAVAGWALRRADLLIALGEVMAEVLERHGVPPARISVAHNWADPDRVHPVEEAENRFLAENGLQGKFVVGYTGNMGLSHEFATLLNAARKLQDRADTVFLFIGSGKQAANLKAHAADLPNVRFLPYIEGARLAEAASAASVHIVTLKPGMEGTVVPSKFYTALAAGRPVIFIGPAHCDLGRIVVRTGCGVHVLPNDVDGLASALANLRGAPGQEAAAAGHALFLREFTRRVGTTRIQDLLASLMP